MSRSRAPIPHLLAVLFLIACGGPPPDRIVVITLDTTRADALGAYGQSDPTSPVIDGMAAEGLLFEQAVSSAPSTLPSHATLFTGKQPYVHGARSNTGYQLAAENETLAEALRARGWRTHAEIAARVLGERTRLDQGFDVYRGPAQTESATEAIERRQHSLRHSRAAEDITERGLAFIREHGDAPFLLWLHYFDPHQPLDPPARFREGLAPYYAEVRRVDHQVGRILEELESQGLRDRVIVVLTADHGEGLGQHGEKSHSFLVYDTTMRVPLVFWGADVVPRGRRAPGLVRVADVAPTLLDLVGLPPLEGIQGVSLRPVFEDPGLDLGLTGYGESLEPMLAFGSSLLRFVRQGRWKYIHKLVPELYDLESDPREVRNLASAQPARLQELQRRLYQLIEEAPQSVGVAEVALDAESIAELQALGYLAVEGGGVDDERSALEVRGPDPTERVDDVRRFSTAVGLYMEKRVEEALPIFRELSAANPDSRAINDALVDALFEAGESEELEAALDDGLRLDPESIDHRVRRARLLRSREPARSEQLLREAVALAGCDWSTPVLNLAHLLRIQDRRAEQRQLLEEQIRACPDDDAIANALAWLLATAAAPELRDGGRAVRLAERAVRRTGDSHAGYLDTLAAAYAEAGDFERARATQGRALEIIEGRDLPSGVVRSYREHMAELEAGRPVRDL